MPGQPGGGDVAPASKALERLEKLVDGGSLLPVEGPGPVRVVDGIATGLGRVEGREVVVFAQDPDHLGGSLGKEHVRRLVRAVDEAVRRGAPVAGLIDSAGARVQEGVVSMSEAGAAIRSLVRASGVVPQVYAVMGNAVGGGAYAAAMGDFLVMVEGRSRMFAWGPGVIRAEGGVEVTAEELGGAATHAARSGACSVAAKDEGECLGAVRRLLGYLPQSRLGEAPRAAAAGPEADGGVFEELSGKGERHVDPRRLVAAVFDAGSFLELQRDFAPNVVTGFARLEGRSVGVVATQPLVHEGYLDVDACDKVCRFVRACDCFNVPVATFVDTPGFMPDPAQEKKGIVRHGAKMMFAYAEATVPKAAVIVGRAYGGGVTGLSSKSLGMDEVLAYENASIQVLSFRSYLEIFQRKALREASAEEREGVVARLLAEYEGRGDPRVAVSLGYVDRLVRPEETRKGLAAVLGRPAERRGEGVHRNMPV